MMIPAIDSAPAGAPWHAMTLLLSIPQRGDGTIDGREIAFR